jgi:hypothetical protein
VEQATQATTPTAPIETDAQEVRVSYQWARKLAGQLVARAQVLPDSVETRRELGTDTFGIRMHFGTGLAAGRGVLEIADVADAAVIREDVDRFDGLSGVWVELRTTYKGVPLIARALISAEDADTLLQPSVTNDETPPIPTVGTSPSDVVAPVVFAVKPLATVNTAAESEQ